jgi:hypothetical protein
MGQKVLGALTVAIVLAVLAACGSDSLLLSMGRTGSDIDVISIADGEVIPAGTPVTVHLSTRSPQAQKDLEMTVQLSGGTAPAGGTSPWPSQRITSPSLNEDIALALPDLPPGQYQVEVAVLSGGEQVAKKVSTFFVVRDSWAVTGIKSFPPVLTADAAVLLRAELAVPGGADPWLRWTWKGAVIARGRASSGTTQVLWTAPAEEGVYSINLELFPEAPADGADYPFTSSILHSTDLYVTGGARLGSGDLSPAESYHTLLHLQGNLRDSGGAAGRQSRSEPAPIGSPQVVQVADGFGYGFDGTAGIAIPWLALPVQDGALAPFTVTVGLTPASFEAEQTILAASSTDGSLSLVVSLDPASRAPAALFTAAGQPPVSIPWKGPELSVGTRSAVSLSVLPIPGAIRAAWFLDGIQVSRFSATVPTVGMEAEGRTVLAGQKGLVGTVDELGVYVKDSQGRPSTDPDLFARAARAAHGEGLVLAEGFDGPFMPQGFPAAEGVIVEGGQLIVPAGTGVELPPLAVPAEEMSFSMELSLTSAQSASLGLSWQPGAPPTVEVALVADAGRMSFAVDEGSLTVGGAGGRTRTVKIPPGGGTAAGLVLRLSVPAESRQPLALDSILATRGR